MRIHASPTRTRQDALAVRSAPSRPVSGSLQRRRAEVHQVLHGPRLQPKLTVGPPDDAYEREADRVADRVMRMPEPDGSLQRMCSECEEELQRQPAEDALDEAPGPETDSTLLSSLATSSSASSLPVPGAATQSQPAPDGRGGEVIHSSATSPEEEPLLRQQGPIPSNTVTCVKKWQYCRAPYSPGTWAARMTYHCPRLVLPWGIILPGTTRPAFATIPDEFIGTSPTGRDMYRCRPRSSVVFKATVADTVATAFTRSQLFPTQAACHAGFRTNLLSALEAMFVPSGGGRPAGIRVNQTPPGGGGVPFPCP